MKMFPGMNPRKMQQMMKQMGIQQVNIPAVEVIIRTTEKELVITNPEVTKVNMMGKVNFQVSGNVEERSISTVPDISEEDVKTVMDQTGVNEETAKNAIEDCKGDLAEAIMNLSQKEE